MQKRIAIKNHHYEIHLNMQRVMIVFGLIVLLVSFLIARLAYLQIYKRDMYVTLSAKNCLDLVPIEPTRGLIYDRKGVLLAENIPVFSLDIIPLQVTDMSKTLMALTKLVKLDENDITQFQKQLHQHRRFDEIPLKIRLSEEEVARITENQYHLPGVIVQARLMRHYPFAENFSHVMGYVGRINTQELEEIDQANYAASHYIGKLGIEKFYEDELHGKVGYEEAETDASGKPIRILKQIKGTPGNNIYLTIDSGLQFAAEKALQGHRGAIVAIQPSTGQVLAMVSKPGFDPNAFVLGISPNDYDALSKSDDKPLYDRALRGQYPIASTIKPYIALAGLDAGIMSEDDAIYDNGIFELPGSEHIFHDWVKNGHGSVNVSKAITSSCDIYYYQLGLKLGMRRMDNLLTQFGFGALSGIDLEDELPGILASPDWKLKNKGIHWFPGDTVISSIGHGYMQATPLQLAVAVAALANRGQRFAPYLLLGEQQPNKPYTQQQPSPESIIKLQDNHEWDIVIKAMQNVVDSPQGTAYQKFGRNYTYTIAAKTGTAAVLSKRINADEEDNQNVIPEKMRDHHLFIAFAPVDQPKIAVAIISENSSVAIEAARILFDYYLAAPAQPLGTQQNVSRSTTTEIKKTGT